MVKVPVAVVPVTTLSSRVGVPFILLHTIPLAVIAAPPSLTIDPPAVAALKLTLVNAAVMTKGAVGGGACFSSLSQPITRIVKRLMHVPADKSREKEKVRRFI